MQQPVAGRRRGRRPRPRGRSARAAARGSPGASHHDGRSPAATCRRGACRPSTRAGQRAGAEAAERREHAVVEDDGDLVARGQRRGRGDRVPRRRAVAGRQRQGDGVLVGAAVGPAAEHDHRPGGRVVAGDVEEAGLGALARRLDERPRRRRRRGRRGSTRRGGRCSAPTPSRRTGRGGRRPGRRRAWRPNVGSGSRCRTSAATSVQVTVARSRRQRSPRSGPGRVPPNSQTASPSGSSDHRVAAAGDRARCRDRAATSTSSPGRASTGRRSTCRSCRRTSTTRCPADRRRAGRPAAATARHRTTWRRTGPATSRSAGRTRGARRRGWRRSTRRTRAGGRTPVPSRRTAAHRRRCSRCTGRRGLLPRRARGSSAARSSAHRSPWWVVPSSARPPNAYSTSASGSIAPHGAKRRSGHARLGEPSESSSERTTWFGEPSESSSERTILAGLVGLDRRRGDERGQGRKGCEQQRDQSSQEHRSRGPGAPREVLQISRSCGGDAAARQRGGDRGGRSADLAAPAARRCAAPR